MQKQKAHITGAQVSFHSLLFVVYFDGGLLLATSCGVVSSVLSVSGGISYAIQRSNSYFWFCLVFCNFDILLLTIRIDRIAAPNDAVIATIAAPDVSAAQIASKRSFVDDIRVSAYVFFF